MDLDELVDRVSEFTDDGIVITEAEPLGRPGPRIRWCNDAVMRLTGYERAELIGRSPRIFQGPETDPATLQRIGARLRAWQPVREQVLNYRKDGTSFWIDLSLRPVADDSGWYRYWVGVQRDVSALIDLQHELARTREVAETAKSRLWSAIEALPDAFVIYDDQDRWVVCNSQSREVYSASADAIHVGARVEEIIRRGLENGQYPEAAGCEQEWLRERLDRHRNPDGPIEQTLPGDRFLKIHEVRTPLGDTVGFRSDVTELRRQKLALEAKTMALKRAMHDADLVSRTDALTGLGNRRGLDL